MQNGGLRRAAADQFGPDPLAANPPYGLVIPDFRYSGKSGIHNHRSVNMDSGLLASLGPGTTYKQEWRKLKMPAYWVARSKINDPVEYKKYTDRVPGIIAKFGGKVLARGGKFQIMEGPDKFQRFVVIEFPSFEQGVACFTSKEYDEAAAFRRSGAGEVETIMVEGGEATK
jgi:uncharacterized protein (DUF1330 family)